MNTETLAVEDFGIETEAGKETKIIINLTDGSFVRVGSIELGEISEDLGMCLRDPHYYHSTMCDICQQYLNESEDFKIERES